MFLIIFIQHRGSHIFDKKQNEIYEQNTISIGFYVVFFTRCAQNDQDAFPFGKTTLDTVQQF